MSTVAGGHFRRKRKAPLILRGSTSQFRGHPRILLSPWLCTFPCCAAAVQMITCCLCKHGLGCFFCRLVGGPGGVLAGSEGIDLSLEPYVGRGNAAFLGLHVGVPAAQVGELLGDTADRLVLVCAVDLACVHGGYVRVS
jgi:hypothetical protein